MQDWQVNAHPLPKPKFKRVRHFLGRFMRVRKNVKEPVKVEARIGRINKEKGERNE